MKNAKKYEAKIKKKLLATLPKAPAVKDVSPLAVMVKAILQADASDRQANQALAGIEKTFVDLNEARVAPIKEIAESFGAKYPHAHRTGELLSAALNALYLRTCKLDLGYITEMQKRDKRRALTELGLDTFAEAMVSMFVFDTHAIPVDQALLESLELDELIADGAERRDVQKFLERIISQKNAPQAHVALRRYVASSAKKLAKHRKIKAKIAEKLQAKADQAEAAVKAKAEAKAAKAAAKAEAQAAKDNPIAKKTKDQSDTKVKADKVKKTQKKSAGKTAAKTSTKAKKKTTKKAVKKVAKKAGGKMVKKAAKKSARKK